LFPRLGSPFLDRQQNVRHHLRPRLYALLALAVDAQGNRVRLLLALADHEDVVDARLLRALDAAHEFVVAEFQLGADLLGTQLGHDAFGVINLRLGHGQEADLVGREAEREVQSLLKNSRRRSKAGFSQGRKPS
jgi:hypothetical protein